MTTRRDFVAVSTGGLIGLSLRQTVFAQPSNVVFAFQGLIAFAVARKKGGTGVPTTTARVTALLVRESVHTVRRLTIPAAWVGQPRDVSEDIGNCSIEVVGPSGGVTLVQGKRGTTNKVLNECGKAGEWPDVTWIANLELACGDGEVRTEMLEAPTAGSQVCTRLIMRGGTFQGGAPSDLSGTVNYARQVWRMDPAPATPYQQCFTDATRWDIGGPSCTIRIIESNMKVRAEYAVKATGSGQIILTNLPGAPRDGAKATVDPTRSEHFHHYYTLVGNPGSSPVPVKAYVCPEAKEPLFTAAEQAMQKLSMDQLVQINVRHASAAVAFGGYLYCENGLVFETV